MASKYVFSCIFACKLNYCHIIAVKTIFNISTSPSIIISTAATRYSCIQSLVTICADFYGIRQCLCKFHFFSCNRFSFDCGNFTFVLVGICYRKSMSLSSHTSDIIKGCRSLTRLFGSINKPFIIIHSRNQRILLRHILTNCRQTNNLSDIRFVDHYSYCCIFCFLTRLQTYQRECNCRITICCIGWCNFVLRILDSVIHIIKFIIEQSARFR